MSDFTVGRKITFGFAIGLTATLVLGLFARSRMNAIDEDANRLIGDCMPGIYDICNMRSHAKETMSFFQSAYLARDKAELANSVVKIAEGHKELVKVIDSYEKTITQPEDRALFNAIAPCYATYKATADKVLALLTDDKKDESLAQFNATLKPEYDKYIASINALVDWNVTAGNAVASNIKSTVSHSQWGIGIAIPLALVLAGLVSFTITRGVNNSLNSIAMTLHSSAEQVAAAATQVAQSSQSMAAGASQQASSLEETSASLEELASMTRQNADNARAARAVSDEASAAAESGQSTTRRMGGELTARIGGMNDAIQKIKGSADQTAKIVKTIDEIAFQTNLLALNAAVEAARAGEAGKGFAVVAEEVRNLAQRSAEAAKNTAALIEESQRNAENGVKASTEVAEILKRAVEVEIARSFASTVDASGKVKRLIGEVAAASSEQSKGVEQINTAVSEMDKITQSNAANAEESAAASEELSAQSRELQDMVNALIKLIRGSSAAASAQPVRQQTIAPAKAQHAPVGTVIRKASAHVPANRIAHLNGSANGISKANGKRKASVAIPLTDDELSGF